ncbi:MAG: serine/threonine-protein kinase [Victivallales bacterium]
MKFQCLFCRNVLEVENSDCGAEVGCPKCGEVTTAPQSPVSTGVVVGNDFLILEEIGRGGMGVVYLTHQMSLDRRAALKILSSKYASISEFVAGFIKEARAAAKLNHPHIVQAYAVGEDNGIYFFAMEYIDGETMKSVLKREGCIPVDIALTMIQQIAESLDYAWKEQRLIHRDIKPDNIMITRNGRAKLADLGLARIAGEIEDKNDEEIMGTPQYISPEHLTGAQMDGRSDIYSLGASFYHIITGQFPFTGKTAAEITRKHVEEPLTPPRLVNPNISEFVSRIIMKMMEKNPNDRYQTAEELVDDIRLARRGKSIAEGKSTGSFTTSTATKGVGKTVIINTAKTRTGPFVPTASSTGKLSSSTGRFSSTSSSIKSGSLGSSSDIRRINEKKAMYQVIAAVTLCVIAALVAVGLAIWKMKPVPAKTGSAAKSSVHTPAEKGKGAGAEKKLPQLTPLPQPHPEPEKTAYTEAAEKLLDFAVKNPNSDADILFKCDEFFVKFPAPVYMCEKKAFADVLKSYVPLDEKRMSPYRKELRREYEQGLKEKELEKQRGLEKIEEVKREKERKEERARLDREKVEEQAKRVTEYNQDLERQRDLLRYRFAYQSVKRNFTEAVAVFDQALKEEGKAPEYLKKDAKTFVGWASKMQALISDGGKLWEDVSNGDKKLAGSQLEVKNSLGKIVSINNGVITVKVGPGLEKVQLISLPMRQFKLLAKKSGSADALFNYLFICGEFAEAKELAPNDEMKNEVSETACAYLTGKLKYLMNENSDTAKQELKELTQKYSRLPEYAKAMQAATAK